MSLIFVVVTLKKSSMEALGIEKRQLAEDCDRTENPDYENDYYCLN